MLKGGSENYFQNKEEHMRKVKDVGLENESDKTNLKISDQKYRR